MNEPDTDSGEEYIRGALADSEQEGQSFLARLAANDPVPGFPVNTKRNGVTAGEWEGDELGLPPECPVIALGVDDGVYWFLDTLGQLRALEFGQFGQKAINSLFMGRHHYLYWAWPRTNKDGAIVSWRQERCAETLMGACAHKGPWNAVERARGRGAWELKDGRLAMHCGTQLFIEGQPVGLGEIGGDVYMTRPPILHPWAKPIKSENGPGSYLLPILRTWEWTRPDIDPLLFLGFLAAAPIGGALPWRPVIYMTGDKATGKSTLQRLLKLILGNALIKSADTTAAGIYQLLKSDALPVAVDELEGKADPRKAKAIIELARLAASGDLMLRGGESHKGTQFNARSCFAFSSINTPPLEPQDLSRMALLRLKRLKPGSTPPLLDQKRLHVMGRMIMRRMMDGWPRLLELYQSYRETLAQAGHDSRGQDTFGMLLTCADILLGDDALKLGVPTLSTDPTTQFWAKNFAAAKMVEYEDALENWRIAVNHLISTPIEAWKSGGQQTIGAVLELLWAGRMDFKEAKVLCQRAGVSLAKPTEHFPHTGLFIPNQNPLLHKIFEGTKFQGELGTGVWTGALRQGPEDKHIACSGRVNGVKSKGTLYALETVLSREGEQPAAALQQSKAEFT